MATYRMLFAGFGGQGLLFMGKIAAGAAVLDGRYVTWFPSYGPEMRGGTANCSVVISDKPIGSPVVSRPDVLVAMNEPSYEKFIDLVPPEKWAFVDSSLITKETDRSDIYTFYTPATALTKEHHLEGGANLILLGKVLKEIGFTSLESIERSLNQYVPKSKAKLIPFNLEAVALGMRQ